MAALEALIAPYRDTPSISGFGLIDIGGIEQTLNAFVPLQSRSPTNARTKSLSPKTMLRLR
jgi:hypothetical protein